MYFKTFYHTISTGEKLKFTIRERFIDNERYFYANMVNTALDFYKALNPLDKENYYGMEITNGKQQSINYKDCEKLINDIESRYEHEFLETEK